MSHISFDAVYTGAHIHEGGLVPTMGKCVRPDYVYGMGFQLNKSVI